METGQEKKEIKTINWRSLNKKLVKIVVVLLFISLATIVSINTYKSTLINLKIMKIFIKNDKPNLYKPLLRQLKLYCGETHYSRNFDDQELNNKSTNTRVKRIINGIESVPHSRPWMVELLHKEGNHLCSGSLIHPYYVLTAAHCVNGERESGIYVKAGLHNTSEGDLLQVEKIMIHRVYRDPYLANDIALIKLTYPANITKKVSLICLPDYELDESHVVGKNAIVAGWGSVSGVISTNNSNNSTKSNDDFQTLKETIVKIGDDQECFSDNRSVYFKNLNYCAFSEQRNSDVCSGDSVEINGLWTVIGVVSFSFIVNDTIICDLTKPAYYAKINKELDWILSKIFKF